MEDTQDDPLIKALMDAGLYGQRMQPLQQRYQLGQQFMETPAARGAQVGNTYVASSPFEHLANAVRGFVGARMMKGAQAGQQDLTSQLGANRSAYAKALQNMSGKPGEFMPGGEGDVQGQQRLAMLGSLSGDPGMENAAKTALQERHLGIQESQMADMMRHRQILEGQGQQKIGLTATEQGHATDAYGNPIMYQKHALPGAVGAAGGRGTPPAAMGMTPEALDNAAQLFAQTGVMPPLRGKAAAGLSVQIQNRAAQLRPELDLAGNKAGYKADTASLTGLQKQADAMNSFEGTALRNLDTFLTAAKGVVDTGSPLFNAPARKFQEAVAGNPKMTAFNVSRQVAVQEISKVLGGSLGGSAVSDSARHEASALLGPDASLAQIFEAARILKQDMANRKASVNEQIGTVRGRAGGKGGQGGAAPAVPAEVANPVRKFTRGPDGKLVEVSP